MEGKNRVDVTPPAAFVATHILLALLIEVPPDKHAAHDVTQVAVDIGHAECLPGGSLLPAVKHPVQGVLGHLKALVQVVDAMADKAPEHVVGDHPVGTYATDTHSCMHRCSVCGTGCLVKYDSP